MHHWRGLQLLLLLPRRRHCTSEEEAVLEEQEERLRLLGYLRAVGSHTGRWAG